MRKRKRGAMKTRAMTETVYKDLECGFWVLSEITHDFAIDMPNTVVSYITLILLHSTLKLYLHKNNSTSFCEFCEKHKKNRWLRRKFRLILSDMHKYARASKKFKQKT